MHVTEKSKSYITFFLLRNLGLQFLRINLVVGACLSIFFAISNCYELLNNFKINRKKTYVLDLFYKC